MESKEIYYKIDKDGYALVNFFDSYGKHLPEKNNSKEEKIPFITWDIKSNVDLELIELVNSEKLTKENILNFKLTDILRGSYYNDYLKECSWKFLKFRPLPIKTYILKTPDEKIPFSLYPHQDKAITFMRERESMNPRFSHGIKGGIIKMEMGLGKTISSIVYSLISDRISCKEEYGEHGFPTLVVASKTVMTEWKTQGFEKFFGSKVKVLYLHSDFIEKSINTITREQVVKYDFVITTYDVCSTVCHRYSYQEECIEMGDEHSLMNGKIVSVHCRTREQSDKPKSIGASIIYTTPWERCFCDESQRFCNPDTKTYRYMMAIYARYKWCITGTPVKNYETDIWAQLRFCGYNGITRKIEWKRRCEYVIKSHELSSAIFNIDYQGAGIKIPEKITIETFVILDGRELECYNYVQGIARNVYDKLKNGLSDFASVLALVTRLRQCSIAPYLITTESKREKGTLSERKKDKEAMDVLKNMYKGNLGVWIHDKMGTAGIYSKKMIEIIETIRSIPDENKVLIFSMFTSVLDLLSDALKEILPEFKFVQIDGDTKGKVREDNLQLFRKDKKVRGLLMTYKVGAEGLNLIEANHVICIEPWWTNAVHKQAIARCHRIGQTRIVEVHNIYVKDSIEERVVKICKGKDELSESILEGTGQQINQGVGLDKLSLGKILGL
jgi:SNF2 family DNA or RNA helicase